MSDEAVRLVEALEGATDTATAGPDAPDAEDPDHGEEPRPAEPADADERPHPDGTPAETPNEGAEVVRDAPAPTRAQLRIDFGAHLEANYRRLVAQLYAITLDPTEAHAVVQDAYSRAWRSWATVSRSPDSVGWVRRVAVRSTIRSWRRLRPRPRRPVGPSPETETGAVLAALRALPAADRRCLVLHHMAGASVQEIAAVERVPVGTTAARLARAQKVVSDGLADFGADFGADLDAAWDMDRKPGTGAFYPDEPSGGFEGWTPRPDDEELR